MNNNLFYFGNDLIKKYFRVAKFLVDFLSNLGVYGTFQHLVIVNFLVV